jgi:hypothetical protein
VHSAGPAFGPRLNPLGMVACSHNGPRPGGGLLTRPMAMRRWPDWPVPAGTAGARGVVIVSGVAAVARAARARRWLLCSMVGTVSTRTVRGGSPSKKDGSAAHQGSRAPMRWRMGQHGGVSLRAVAQSRRGAH